MSLPYKMPLKCYCSCDCNGYVDNPNEQCHDCRTGKHLKNDSNDALIHVMPLKCFCPCNCNGYVDNPNERCNNCKLNCPSKK